MHEASASIVSHAESKSQVVEPAEEMSVDNSDEVPDLSSGVNEVLPESVIPP